MGKVSDEEFQELESETRHKEILAAVNKITTPILREIETLRSEVKGLGEPKNDQSLADAKKEILARLDTLEKTIPAPEKVDMQPVVKAVTDQVKEMKHPRPKSFRIERNNFNQMIERVVPEYEKL